MSAFNVRTRRILLPSAARNATTVAANISKKDAYSYGLRFYLNVTASSGTGGLKVLLRGYDTISGNTVAINTGGTAVTANGLYAYEIYPGASTAPAGNVMDRVSSPLPVQWDAQVVHGDGSSYTYSLSVEVL